MKKYLSIIVFIVLLPLSTYAQKTSKLIKQLDVISYLPAESDSDPVSFWRAIKFKDNDITRLLKKVHGSKLGQKAQQEVYNFGLQTGSYYSNVTSFDENLDTLRLYVEGNAKCLHFRYVNLAEENASTSPNGLILIYKGLINKLYDDCIIAVSAHEAAHYYLEHSVVQTYKVLKRQRSNNILAGLTVGLQAFGDVMNAANTGKTYNASAHQDYYQLIFNLYGEATTRYHFSYGREQEIQADIVAFRLLDWIGIGGEALIDAFEILRKPFEYSSPYSDHPTMSYRINLLKELSKLPRKKGDHNIFCDKYIKR